MPPLPPRLQHLRQRRPVPSYWPRETLGGGELGLGGVLALRVGVGGSGSGRRVVGDRLGAQADEGVDAGDVAEGRGSFTGGGSAGAGGSVNAVGGGRLRFV